MSNKTRQQPLAPRLREHVRATPEDVALGQLVVTRTVPLRIDYESKLGTEVKINQAGTNLWINVDGICVCRVLVRMAAVIVLEDERKAPDVYSTERNRPKRLDNW